MNQNEGDQSKYMFQTLLVVISIVFILGGIIGAVITFLIQK